MNKKGSIQDVPLLLTFTFVIAIVVMSGAEVMNRLNADFQSEDVLSNVSQQQFNDLTNRYTQVWDSAFMLIIGLFGIALLLSTAALGTRPEFFFIIVLISMFLVGIAAALSNIFAEFFDKIGNEAGFTFIPLFMNNLVEVLLILIVLLIIGLFVKIRGIV